MLTSDLNGPAPLLLDTHIWVWAAEGAGGGGRFKRGAARPIEAAAEEGRLLASAASVWEIALKVQKGELIVSGDLRAWVREQTRYPGIRILPMNASLALDATSLPEWVRKSDGRPHKDPSDRFIVAEARRRNAVLITCDALMIDYARGGNMVVFDARV
ncbi:MAG: type II toxin-antitoxin system VapC family toxin [Gemmatimonadales bacterium]